MARGTEREQKIRQHAHRLAAEGLFAALNQWELDLYYEDEDDQTALETELLAIAKRLRRQGEPR